MAEFSVSQSRASQVHCYHFGPSATVAKISRATLPQQLANSDTDLSRLGAGPSTRKARFHAGNRASGFLTLASGAGQNYCTMSLSAFNGRTLTTFLAGLAVTSISSPGLNGLGTPFLALAAGLWMRTIFNRRGRATTPGPFLPICAATTAVRPSSTLDTCLRARPELSARLLRISDLEIGFTAFSAM